MGKRKPYLRGDIMKCVLPEFVFFNHKYLFINPLTHGRFSEGDKTKFLDFFSIGTSATKSFARSRIWVPKENFE